MVFPYPVYSFEYSRSQHLQAGDFIEPPAPDIDETLTTARCRTCRQRFFVVDPDADCQCNACRLAAGKPMLLRTPKKRKRNR